MYTPAMADLLRVVDFVQCESKRLRRRERGTYTDRFTGDVDDMDLEMNLEDSQDDPAGRATVTLKVEGYTITV